MKKGFGTLFVGIYVLSTVFFYDHMATECRPVKSYDGLSVSPEEFGVMCLSAAYPGISQELYDAGDDAEETDMGSSGISLVVDEKKPLIISSDEPLVLIVHTHATESYMPAEEGNYHTTAHENTVRDVGSVLAKTLEANGVGVIHNQTLHDSPSYNQSYSRSYNTTEELLEKYPSIVCIIDLHRDAIAADSPAATVSVEGRNCAKYSYVVSTAVETYEDNLEFIKAMNETAEEEFSGFTGKVLERGYRYNQNLSSRYMLLEIGYNRNDITEARNTAKIFGEILAATLRGGH